MTEHVIPIHCKIASNGDLCAEHACLVETFFVNKVADFILPGAPAGFMNLNHINMGNLHSAGFDSDRCAVFGAGFQDTTPVKACCGVHLQSFEISREIFFVLYF